MVRLIYGQNCLSWAIRLTESHSMSKKRVVVGISGGADSAVCAHLLKQEGHEVIGVFMQNWETNNDDPFCTAEQDKTDAHAVCQHLGIEFQSINFAKEYWDNVFQYCLDEFTQDEHPTRIYGVTKKSNSRFFYNMPEVRSRLSCNRSLR